MPWCIGQRAVKRKTDKKIELDEYSLEELNRKLNYLRDNLESEFTVKITYFEPDKTKEGGKYLEITDCIVKFREYEQEIINNQKIKNNTKTLIIVDEAHMFIDQKYPVALDFFYQMNKRIRKYNGSFIPTTQNISDWNSNNELKNKTSTIIKNSQYTFIFKSSSPDMQDILDLYKAGNSFNKEERKIIISSSIGQTFFISSSELRFPVKIMMNENIKKLFEGK